MKKTTIALILAGLLIMCFTKCRTANELINKALNKDSAAVAAQTRALWPCVTTAVKTDSTEYNKWRKAADSTERYYDSLIAGMNNRTVIPADDYFPPQPCDTLRLSKALFAAMERNRILFAKAASLSNLKAPPAIHDTIYKDDPASGVIYRAELEELQKQLDKSNAKAILFEEENKQLEATINSMTWRMWVMLALIIALLLWIFRKPLLNLVKLIGI